MVYMNITWNVDNCKLTIFLGLGVSIAEWTMYIVVNEFKHYYIHFQTNTFGKGINSFIPPLPAWIK